MQLYVGLLSLYMLSTYHKYLVSRAAIQFRARELDAWYQFVDVHVQDYLQGNPMWLQAVKYPLASLGYETKYDIIVKAEGGGLSAQAQAILLGIARALIVANQANRDPLKKQGLLTRDSRIVERKKYGLHKARKAPQYSKR